MKSNEKPMIQLRSWNTNDLSLLFLLNTADMTVHLGGPETAEKVKSRHQRYLNIGDSGKVFCIIKYPEQFSVGSICYWSSIHNGEYIFEIGWGILPPYQGLEIATIAATLAIEEAKRENKHPYMHAFLSILNEASNAICKKLDFEFISECDFEYPKGSYMKCNNWRLKLLKKDVF